MLLSPRVLFECAFPRKHTLRASGRGRAARTQVPWKGRVYPRSKYTPQALSRRVVAEIRRLGEGDAGAEGYTR